MKKESDPTCPLCNEKPQTLEHVLSSCKTALLTEDTLGDTTVYWTSWPELYGT